MKENIGVIFVYIAAHFKISNRIAEKGSNIKNILKKYILKIQIEFRPILNMLTTKLMQCRVIL